MVEARLDGERVRASRPILNGANTLFHFLAEDIRREHTGVHAKVTLGLNTTILAWSNFNVERDEDRTRIANRAFLVLPPTLRGAYPKEHLKHEVDLFCLHLWDVYQGHYVIQEVPGQMQEGGIEYYLRPYIPKDTGSIIFGPPGRGKSYVMMIMAVCMDAGESDWWDCNTPTKVLFVNLERSARSLQHRLARVNLCLGYVETRSISMLNARGHSLADVRDVVKRGIETEGVEVVCVDSISRAGMGDLNANDKVNAICDTLNNITQTWMALGHSPRGDASHLFGGVHFDAAADVMVKLSSERQEQTLGISLEITKGNDLPDFPEEYLALDFDGEIGLVGIRRPGVMEFSELALAKKPALLTQVIDYLKEAQRATATEIANDISGDRTNISRLLASRPEFVRLQREGRGVFYGLKASV